MTNIFNFIFNSNIKEKPEFFSKTNHLLNNDRNVSDNELLEMPDNLLNMRLEVAKQENDYIGAWEIEVIKKARFYNIPYQPNNIDWDELDNKITEYQALLNRAHELNFNWDTSTYEPVALADAIKECEENNEHAWYYNFLYRAGRKKHA